MDEVELPGLFVEVDQVDGWQREGMIGNRPVVPKHQRGKDEQSLET
jgi:hypothetical protein